MRKLYLLALVLSFISSIKAQTIKVNAGPEFLHSFNHDLNFWGVGVSAQGEV